MSLQPGDLTGTVEELEMLLSMVPEILQHSESSQLVQRMERFKTVSKEIKLLQKMQQEQAKEDMEAFMTEEEKVVQDKQVQDDQLSQAVKQEQHVQENLLNFKHNNTKGEEDCMKLRDSLKQLKAEKEKILQEKERLDNETTILVPKKREEFSIYGHLSKIRWDIDTSQVKGYVSSKEDVKPFCFDKNKCSKHFIVNSLWDMIPEDW